MVGVSQEKKQHTGAKLIDFPTCPVTFLTVKRAGSSNSKVEAKRIQKRGHYSYYFDWHSVCFIVLVKGREQSVD